MNAFADWLFALLLGWTRSLFNGMWNLLTDQGGGVSGFLRSFWLPLILILLAFGTLMDYVVWMIRWRPYFVWRSWFLRKARKRRMDRTNRYMQDLDQAPLDLPEYHQEDDDAVLNAPIDFVFQPSAAFAPVLEETQAPFPLPVQEAQQPVWEQDLAYQVPLIYEDGPGEPIGQEVYEAPPANEPYVPSLPWETVGSQSPPVAPYPIWQQEAEPAAPPYAFEETSYPQEQEQATALSKPTRRRRAEAKRRRQGTLLKTMKDTLFSPEDGSDAVDSLPPPMAVEDAFHEPYYPQNYSYKSQVLPPNSEQDPST